MSDYPVQYGKGHMDQTAQIIGGAKIGERTSIWKFSYVRETAVIGDHCQIGSYVYVDNNVKIGNNVKIQNKCELYDGLTIEDDVFIGPAVTFTNVINPRAFIDRRDEFQSTLIKKGASIGAGAVILCGVTIGKYALIGAGSVITKDVGDFRKVFCRQRVENDFVCKCGGLHLTEAEGNILYCPDCQKRYVWKGTLNNIEEI